VSEFVIGTGHQRSIRDVLKIVEEHILHTEGIPRKLMARSPSFKAVAWRSDFKGDFEAFSLLQWVKRKRPRYASILTEV